MSDKIKYNSHKGEEIEADKRFVCFAFSQYYPNGGLGDSNESFDDLEYAIRHLKNLDEDYKYIYDRIEGKEIEL